MGRAWGYVVSAVVAVTGEVTVSVIANSMTMPKKYYLTPLFLFLALCLLMAAADFLRERGQRQNPPSQGRRPAGPTGPRIVLRRGWDEEPRLMVMIGLFGLFALLNAQVFFGGHPGVHWTVAQQQVADIVVAGCTGVLGPTIAWLLVSRRPGIIVSAQEVVVFDRRGTRIVLPWSEVNDIYTDAGRGGAWLLATVPPHSPLIYQSPTAKLYDSKQGVLKVCDLRHLSLLQHQVDGALNAFHP